MKFTLALDTTSNYCSITILKGEEILTEFNFISSEELSKTLVSYIDSVFLTLKINADDIGLIGVSVGPGFFTGIRVGLATLKGLFFGKPIPVVPVSSLEAAAAKLTYTGMTIIPILDARREEIYFASYKSKKNDLVRSIEPTLIKVGELKGELQNESNICFTGMGSLVYKDLLSEDFPGSIVVNRSPFISSEVGSIALTEFNAGNYKKGTGNIEPLYIRIPDAEKNFGKRKN